MTDIDLLFEKGNPNFIAKLVAQNFKKTRIAKSYTQEELSIRSGVALSSLKRFEQKGEISLKPLLKLAIVLDATENFGELFKNSNPATLDEFIRMQAVKERKRVRKK